MNKEIIKRKGTKQSVTKSHIRALSLAQRTKYKVPGTVLRLFVGVFDAFSVVRCRLLFRQGRRQ